jgi:hypothetical protein
MIHAEAEKGQAGSLSIQLGDFISVKCDELSRANQLRPLADPSPDFIETQGVEKWQ